MQPPASIQRVIFALLGVWTCLCAPVLGEKADSFETDGVAWRIESTDCPKLKSDLHHRAWGEARTGRRSEFIQVRAFGGSHVYLTYDIPPSRLLDEFQPRVWVRTNKPGIRFYLRAVLPRTLDEKTGKPLTTLLPGDAIEAPGAWTMLSIRDVRKLLDRAVPRLRREFGSHVDGREAYVDKLVLNVYGGPGVTKVWIDDLTYQEFPPPQVIVDPNVQAAQATSGGEAVAPAPPTKTRGDVFLAGDRPWFARIIEHHGEPLAWLHELGFTGVMLEAPATPAQLREANRLGLWLIAPPPAGAILEEHNAIAAWRLGEGLGKREIESVRQLASETRRRDVRQGRPLLIGAKSHGWDYRRSGDVFLLDQPVIAAARGLSEQGRWWQKEPERSRLAGPVWAAIPTQLPKVVEEQVIAHEAGASLPFAYVEPDQMRALAYHALASGVRGLVFRSSSPLDREDAASRIRAKTLELLLRELTLIEPWVAGGVSEGDASVQNQDVRVSVLRTERAQLLMITRLAQHQQFVIGASGRSEIGLTTNSISSSAQAYRLTFTTLQPLRTHRAPGGFRIRLADGEVTSLVLLTQNPRVMEYIGRKLLEQGPLIAHLRFEIAEMHWDRTRRIIERLAALGASLPRSSQRIQQAREQLDQSRERLQAGDLDWSVSLANSAMTTVSQLRRGHWEQAAMAFSAPQAAPLCADFALLPEHWGLSQRVGRGVWGVNLLPGGDFESLDHMLQTGWQRNADSASGAETQLELSLQNPRSGRRALRLTAATSDPNRVRTMRDEPWLQVASAPIAIKQGQIARIHGWVKTNSPIADPGFWVYDSISGRDFGRHITSTEGWTEFTLYRAAPRDDYLVVKMELLGMGDVMIDDVTVSVLQQSSRAPTGPAANAMPTGPSPNGNGPVLEPPRARLSISPGRTDPPRQNQTYGPPTGGNGSPALGTPPSGAPPLGTPTARLPR